MSALVDISEVLLELGLSSSATDEERAVTANAIRFAEGAVRRYLHYDPLYGTRTEFYPQLEVAGQADFSVWEVSESTAYQRQIPAVAARELQLRSLPVRSITALYVDHNARSGSNVNAFANETLQVEGSGYWANYDRLDSSGNKICLDGILRSDGLWPVSAGTIKVVYVSGYTAAELHGQDTALDALPILESVIMESTRRVRRMFSLSKKTGAGFIPGIMSSENLGDYSYSIDTSIAKDLLMGGDLLAETQEKLSSFVNYGFS
jgi:hypothetical protein